MIGFAIGLFGICLLFLASYCFLSGKWPGKTIPSVTPKWHLDLVDQVKRRYATTDMTLEQFERDLDVAFRIEAGDIPKGGFVGDELPRYLMGSDGTYLAMPPSTGLIGGTWTDQLSRHAQKVMILPPGAEVTPLPEPVIPDPSVPDLRRPDSADWWAKARPRHPYDTG